MSRPARYIFLILIFAHLSGCASQNSRLLASDSQVQTRSIQTRSFDTNDKALVARNVISTLQDMNFVIDKADLDLGTISATKLSGYQIKMTVTVRTRRNGLQLLVRANARYNLETIVDPEMYQDFFNALGKSLFLAANDVE